MSMPLREDGRNGQGPNFPLTKNNVYIISYAPACLSRSGQFKNQAQHIDFGTQGHTS